MTICTYVYKYIQTNKHNHNIILSIISDLAQPSANVVISGFIGDVIQKKKCYKNKQKI